MNSVEELVRELCPNGVDFLEVGELFDLRNGYTPSKSNASFWQGGDIPWFRMEDIRTNGRVLNQALQYIPTKATKAGKVFPANSILISTSATIGEHALVTVPHLSNQRFTSLAVRDKYSHLVEMKFIFYYSFVLSAWCKENTTMSSFAGVEMAGFKRFKFPIPPLEVQHEIVQILDTFTELEAELEAELEVRKKQYEYYRNNLLTFPEPSRVQWVPIAEVLNYEQPTKYLVSSSDYSNNFKTPVLTAGQTFILGYTNEDHGVYPASDTNPVIIFDDFTTAKKWVNFPFKAKSSAMKMITAKNEDVDLRFAYFYMQTIGYQPVDHARQWIATYSQFLMPLPEFSEQVRIVNLLNKFDSLINDISSGLPAEIEKRRVQYEQYRSRLLNFKEIV